MNREMTGYIAWAVAILAVALAVTWARRQGVMDGEAVTRVVIGLNGLMLAWIGNRLPKMAAPTAAIGKVKRVGGWAMVLSGLVYAALWAFAPMSVAVAAGSAAIISGIMVTTAYCLTQRAKAAPPRQ